MDHHPSRPCADLLAFAAAIGACDSTLRRGNYGDWHISGSKGRVYSTADGFEFVVNLETPDGSPATRAWEFARRGLAFADIRNDGESEVVMILARLPSPSEGIAVRHYLGIAKRREVSPGEIIRRVSLDAIHGLAKAA